MHGMCHAIEDPTFDATAGRDEPARAGAAAAPAAACPGRSRAALSLDDHDRSRRSRRSTRIPYRCDRRESRRSRRSPPKCRSRTGGERRARRLGRLLRRLRSRLRARRSLASRARDRAARGRGAEPPAAARASRWRSRSATARTPRSSCCRRSSPGSAGMTAQRLVPVLELESTRRDTTSRGC